MTWEEIIHQLSRLFFHLFARLAEAELCELGCAHLTVSLKFLELTMKVAEDMFFVVGRLPTLPGFTLSAVPNSRVSVSYLQPRTLGQSPSDCRSSVLGVLNA